MLRNTNALRRVCSWHVRRRRFHDDSSRADFLTFSSSKTLGSDPRFGMDMTRAPGYEVAADDESPLVGDKKIADFAARHARLSLTEVEHAPGYLWVGSVLYPFGPNPDVDILFSWENEVPKLDSEFGAANEEETDADEYVDQSDDEDLPALEAKRRYTGGQARRIRKERERNADRKPASRPSRRPIRKPENDIPEEA